MARIRSRSALALASLLAAWGSLLHAATPPADRHGDPLPAGAVARLGSVRFLHDSSISSLSFASDGKTLVSGTQEPFFRMWDAATGREVRRFTLKDSTVMFAAFSPDGRLAASSDNGDVLTVWDAATGKQLYSRSGVSSYNAPLAWTPDSKFLVIASGNVINLLNPTTGKTLRAFGKTSQRRIMQLAFSPDGKLLLGSGEPTNVWDVATGKVLHQLEGNSDFAGCLAFSPDGKMVAGDCSYPVNDPPGATRSTFRLWDVASGKKIRDLPAWSINCAVFSPDGKIVAAGDCDHCIRQIDPLTGKVMRQWRAHEYRVTALAFSRDGKVLASGGSDQRIRLWDAATGKELHPAPGHRGPVKKVVFAPDGRSVVSVSVDRTIHFWDWTTGREWSRGEDLGDFQGVHGLVYSPDGKSLASLETHLESVWKANEVIRLWDPSTGKMISRYMLKEPDRIGAIAFLMDNKTLAASFWDGSIGLWQPATGKWLRRLGKSEKGIAALIPLPDGKSIAGAAFKKHFGIRDLTTGKDRCTFKDERFTVGSVIALSPNGAVLAVQAHHVPLCFWDIATGKKLYELELDRSEGDHSARALAFSPDGSMMATAEYRQVRLWDLRSRKEFRRLSGHQGEVNAIAFSPDGRVLVSASDDGTLLVWDMTGRLHAGQLAAVALKPEELEQHWRDLGAADAAMRWRAIWTLAACPQTASFLSTKLRPVPIVPADQLKKLVADLDNDMFAVREKASHRLAEIGEIASPSLQEALSSQASVEARRRIEDLLTRLKPLEAVPPSEERLRVLSGVTVLEHINNEDAKKVLQTLATGAPQARLTREAKAALLRLSKRSVAHP